MKFIKFNLLLLMVICNVAIANTTAILEQQVADVERAFAKTMADRDHLAFARFIADEAIFLSGKKALRGKEAVVSTWKKYYDTEQAPFSWEPETVVVLESGKIALSTGPVFNTTGTLISYYTSTWRMEKDGTWKIILDKGNKACPTPK